MRLLPDDMDRPCAETLRNCNKLTESDEINGKFTEGKLLSTYVGEDLQLMEDSIETCGLHFDLPSTELFEHGQILIVIHDEGITEGLPSTFKQWFSNWLNFVSMFVVIFGMILLRHICSEMQQNSLKQPNMCGLTEPGSARMSQNISGVNCH